MARKIRSADSEETVETKAKRIAISATIAGVLLIVFLLVFMIIQFAIIGEKNAEKRKLNDQIEQYEKLNGEIEKDIDFYKTQEGLRMLAVMNGWTKPSGK